MLVDRITPVVLKLLTVNIAELLACQKFSFSIFSVLKGLNIIWNWQFRCKKATLCSLQIICYFSIAKYIFKVFNKNNRLICWVLKWICRKLILRHQNYCYLFGIFIVYIELIQHKIHLINLVFLLRTWTSIVLPDQSINFNHRFVCIM